jgi:uncharacterized OsmC-like protein
MSEATIVNAVTSQNTHVYGRTLNSARMHHFVIDGTRDPKEELTPVEVFLSGVSACCVQWVEQFAREDGVNLVRIQVEIIGTRTTAEPTRFQAVELTVKTQGPSQAQLEDFVERFKQRCPLYRTVATATEVRFSLSSGDKS